MGNATLGMFTGWRRTDLLASASQGHPDGHLAKQWWDSKANAKFQHLDRRKVEPMLPIWKKFLRRFEWADKSVLDYGIGGGYLGELLFKKYDISRYVGVDISEN